MSASATELPLTKFAAPPEMSKLELLMTLVAESRTNRLPPVMLTTAPVAIENTELPPKVRSP